MYAFMRVCVNVCMYVCMYSCMHACNCMYVRRPMYVCNVCAHGCFLYRCILTSAITWPTKPKIPFVM